MGALSEKLFKVGLLSEKQFQKQQTEEELMEEQNQKARLDQLKKDRRMRYDELDYCDTMHDFKHLAKQILLQDPSQIRIIIQKAHRFKKHNQGRKFVWFFYQVRDGLQKLPIEKHKQFLNRAFRKSGATFKVS